MVAARWIPPCRCGWCCWRPGCVFLHDAGQARHEHIRDMADFWAEAFEVASVFPQERASERVQQHAAEKGVPRFREETAVEVRAGEAEVLEIIIVSDAVEGTFVDLDGEQIVDTPVPQIVAKIPEVVEPTHQKHLGRLASAASARGFAPNVRRDRRVGEIGRTGTSATANRPLDMLAVGRV